MRWCFLPTNWNCPQQFARHQSQQGWKIFCRTFLIDKDRNHHYSSIHLYILWITSMHRFYVKENDHGENNNNNN